MKKRCTPAKILAILLVLMMCFATSCSLVKDSPTRLNTPSGLRVEDGTLYWNPIEYATKYLVSIDGNEFYSDDYRYSLAKVKDGEHKFKVKAIGDGVTYSSSDYSKEYITNIYDGHEASGDSYDHFDDLINGESFLGYGFDVIKSSVFSDKYVKLNFPIFDNEQLMQQRLLKVDSKNLYVNEVQSADIEEFIAQWNVSANVNVSWGGSVGLKAAYTGGTEATRSKYFHCISYNNQQFYIVMQSDMNTYRNMLSEGFEADLYSADIDPATLFEKYGTHFITSAIMGGRINSYYLYTSEETIDFHDVSAEVSVNIRYLIGQTNVNVGGGYNEYAKNHNINIKNTFEVIGGNNLGMKSDADIATYYTDWEKSLENNASLIGIKDAGSLQPIWELIDSSLDTKQYSWDYDGDGVYETGSRAQQLQAYFYAYGIENYNDLRSAAGIHEIVVPKEITNVKVNGQDALSTGEFEVYAGETNDITFNVLPDDATYTKKVSVADSVTYATINEYNQLILTADAPHNTTLNLVISAGNITKQITVKIIKAYTVEFETNFDIAVPSITNVKYGRQIEEPELPNRDGYVLAGWYTSPNFNEETKFIFGEHAVTSNLILYARWVKEYSISYVLNGGEFSGSVIEKYTSISNLVLPTPSKAHYYFGGWYLDESLNNAASVDEIVNNPRNITLYAKWVGEGYTVTYVLNGGEFTSNVGGTYTIESGLVLPTPNKRYYDFGGWYLDESLNNAASEDEINENPRNITLYAKWVAITYTISFVNDSGATVSSQTVPFGTTIELSSPTHSYGNYYTFAGWSDNTRTYNGTYTLLEGKDIILTAVWNQTYADYTYIFTADDFKWHIGNNLQKTSKPSNCGTGKYMLLNDIDLGDWNEGWGYTYWAANYESATLNGKTCFMGIFDGQNHTITYKLRVGQTNLQSWAFGLFPVTDGATIKNLNVKADLSTYDPQNRGQKWHISNDDRAEDAMVGGLVGYAKNTIIENCSVSGRVIYNSEGGGGDTCVAGVVGYAYNSTVRNCSSSAEVYARGFYVNVAGVMACYYNTSYSGLSATGYIHYDEPWAFGGHWSGNEVTKSLQVLTLV